MKRMFVVLVLAGSAIGVATLGVAQAAPSDVVPVQGGTGCTVSPPHLLGAGRAPLAPLRLDLAPIAHHTQVVHEVESFATRARLLDGAWHSALQIRKITAVTRGLGISRGQIKLSSKYTVTFQKTKTTAGGRNGSFTLKGHSDALSGGSMGGVQGNDRFPVEPIGVGARWRVVNCDAIDETPAKETRTYTVRSFSPEKVVLTFRDVVSLDPRHRDMGTQKVGTEVVRFRLDHLSGTARGTARIPLANGVATSGTQVTRLRFTFHAISKNVPSTPVITDLVDTRTDTPAA